MNTDEMVKKPKRNSRVQFVLKQRVLRDPPGATEHYTVIFEEGIDGVILKQAYDALPEDVKVSVIGEFRGISTPARVRRLIEVFQETNVDRVLAFGRFVSSRLLGKRFTNLTTAHGALYELDETGIIIVPTTAERDYRANKNRKRDIQRWATVPYTRLELGRDYVEVKAFPQVRNPNTVFLDIETLDSNGESSDGALDVMTNTIMSIQVAVDNGPVWYLYEPSQEDLRQLYAMCEEAVVVVHNALFDISVLSRYTGLPWYQLHIRDTMLMARSRGGETVNLKHLSTMLTDGSNPLAYQTAAHTFDKAYAVADVLAMRGIYDYFMKRGFLLIDELNAKANSACIKAKISGIRLSTETLENQHREVLDDLQNLEFEIADLARVPRGKYDVGKTADKVSLLLACKVPLTERTPSGNTFSVSKDILRDLAPQYPIVEKVLEYQELRTYLDHFLTPYLKRKAKFVHPSIRIMATRTGRTAGTDPNIQNAPPRIKEAFISRFPNGVFTYFDLVASEMRTVAMASGDEHFCEALMNYDIHSLVASRAFSIPYEELIRDKKNTYRAIAKTVGFGLLYGGTAKGLSHTSGASVSDVQRVIDTIFEQFPKLQQYLENSASSAVEKGYSVDVYGKVRSYFELRAQGNLKSIERQGKNTPIQAMSAYMCLELFSYIFGELERREMQSIVVMQIHDSVYIDTHPEEKDEVRAICREAFKALHRTPVSKLPGWGLVPVEGEILVSETFNNKDCDVLETLSTAI